MKPYTDRKWAFWDCWSSGLHINTPLLPTSSASFSSARAKHTLAYESRPQIYSFPFRVRKVRTRTRITQKHYSFARSRHVHTGIIKSTADARPGRGGGERRGPASHQHSTGRLRRPRVPAQKCACVFEGEGGGGGRGCLCRPSCNLGVRLCSVFMRSYWASEGMGVFPRVWREQCEQRGAMPK